MAIALYVATLLLQSFFTHRAQHFREHLLRQTDSRVKSTSEALRSIRFLKLACLEDIFLRVIATHRQHEMKLLRKLTAALTVGVNATAAITPSLVAATCFAIFAAVAQRPLSPTVAFTSLSLFKLLDFPFAMLPSSLASVVQFKCRFLESLMQSRCATRFHVSTIGRTRPGVSPSR